MWDVGLDYMHGTGHGIGAYLNVHEGPMGISWREIPNDPGLQSGMFLSNGNILIILLIIQQKLNWIYILHRAWVL